MSKKKCPLPYLSDEELMTSATFEQLFFRIQRMAMNIVRWGGLPEGVKQIILERYLFEYGCCAFFYDEMLGRYLVLPVITEYAWDQNDWPTEYEVTGFRGYRKRLSVEDSVLIFDNYLFQPGMVAAQLFASRLTNALRTTDVHLEANKIGKIIVAPQTQKKTANTLIQRVRNFCLYTIGSSALGEMSKNIYSVDTQPNFILDKLDFHYTYTWNDVLTYYGVYGTSPKASGVNALETGSEASNADINRMAIINPRQDAAEQINKMFGLNVTVGSNVDYLQGEGGDQEGREDDGRIYNDSENSSGDADREDQ